MRLQRLFAMGPAELAFRGRQEVFKVVDRLSAPQAGEAPACRFDRSALGVLAGDAPRLAGQGEDPEARSALLLRLRDAMGRRFFAGLQPDWQCDAVGSRLRADFGFEPERLIARAEAICEGRFEILGYGELSFGRPVNWRLDPVSGRESPWKHWSRLDPLAPEQVGDSKVVWELNRHQWVLELGQAYRLSGDERYAECFLARTADWMARNPVGWGINWSSVMDAALRLISWCWALCLFRDAPALTPERLLNFLAWLQRHGEFVERYHSRYFAPNTHLTAEALGLYYLGTLLPELRGAQRWRALGRRLLLEQLPVQVPEDGVYFEQSTHYQYYTVEIFLHFALLAARNDDPVPDIVHQRLAAMLRFLRDVRRPDGTVPQIGDADGGWLCPLVRRAPGDFRGLFATGALLLEDPGLAWAADALTPETFCLLGERAHGDWQALTRTPPPPTPVSVYSPGGYVVMRSGWERRAHQLIFDTGPLGSDACSGHGHADLLAVQCSAFGENYLVDPGTGSYTTGAPWREYFRSTGAHSTVLVDGLDQAATDGPFAWRERPVARLLETGAGPSTAFAAAQHDAYRRLADPVTHRRRVWFLDSVAWLIVDDLIGARRHRVDLRFQFAPLPVARDNDGWIRARGRASGLLLKTFAGVDLAADLVAGAREPLLGWYSPNYGRQVPAPALTLRAEGDLPLRFATLVVPVADPDAPAPRVVPRLDGRRLAGLSVQAPDLHIPDFDQDAARPARHAGNRA